jgi:hypothetical protein
MEAVFESLLSRLSVTADDRIRDIQSATQLLIALVKAIKVARRDNAAHTIPTQRIIQRLCYFGSARDTGVRSDTFRIVRHLIVDRESALCVVRERMVLSISRALDREPKLMWERVQALKAARAIMDFAPEATPFIVLRSLLAIATFSIPTAPSGGGGAGAAAPQARAGGAAADVEGAAAPMAMGRRQAPGVLDGGMGGGFADDGVGGAGAASSSPASQPPPEQHDPLRRVAVDTLRSACLSPLLLPRLSAVGVVTALCAAVVDLAVSPQVCERSRTTRGCWFNHLGLLSILSCMHTARTRARPTFILACAGRRSGTPCRPHAAAHLGGPGDPAVL